MCATANIAASKYQQRYDLVGSLFELAVVALKQGASGMATRSSVTVAMGCRSQEVECQACVEPSAHILISQVHTAWKHCVYLSVPAPQCYICITQTPQCYICITQTTMACTRGSLTRKVFIWDMASAVNPSNWFSSSCACCLNSPRGVR